MEPKDEKGERPDWAGEEEELGPDEQHDEWANEWTDEWTDEWDDEWEEEPRGGPGDSECDDDEWGPWKEVIERSQRGGRRRGRRTAKWEIARAFGGPPPRPKEPISGETPVTAVDLRRRTSEIFAALERNEEMVLSYRGRWVGLLTPLMLLQKENLSRPVTEQRYFGFANQARRLRRNPDWHRDPRHPPPFLPGEPDRPDQSGGPDSKEDDGNLDDDCAGSPCPV